MAKTKKPNTSKSWIQRFPWELVTLVILLVIIAIAFLKFADMTKTLSF